MLEIGSSLREARSRCGFELAEVEAATMIRVRYLVALENERFEVLPVGSYRQSFLREYAEFLGLDGAIFAEEYELRLAPPAPEPPKVPAQRAAVVVSVLTGARWGRRAALAAAVVTALVGLGVWQLAGAGGPTTVASGPSPSPPAVSRARSPSRPTRRGRSPAAGVAAEPSGAVSSSLALTAARGSCWLWVRVGSATGPTIYERTLERGQTIRFGVGKQLWIRFGAPWNLDAAVGGRSLTAALPRRTGDLMASGSGFGPAA